MTPDDSSPPDGIKLVLQALSNGGSNLQIHINACGCLWDIMYHNRTCV